MKKKKKTFNFLKLHTLFLNKTKLSKHSKNITKFSRVFNF